MKKFYCQDCGQEVPLNADSCPKCGKDFGSVLCPKCNYSGSSNEFYNGCPKCGYLKREEIFREEGMVKNITLKKFTLLFILLVSAISLLVYLF